MVTPLDEDEDEQDNERSGQGNQVSGIKRAVDKNFKSLENLINR